MQHFGPKPEKKRETRKGRPEGLEQDRVSRRRSPGAQEITAAAALALLCLRRLTDSSTFLLSHFAAGSIKTAILPRLTYYR